MTDLQKLASEAREHADRLVHDISLCSNRDEHLRVTARANEAEALALALAGLLVNT